MKVPIAVQKAQQYHLPMQITGYLVDVELRPDQSLRGAVYSDIKGLKDGSFVSISPVIDIRIDLPRHVARTVSDGYYVICNYVLPGPASAPGVSIEFKDSPTLH